MYVCTYHTYISKPYASPAFTRASTSEQIIPEVVAPPLRICQFVGTLPLLYRYLPMYFLLVDTSIVFGKGGRLLGIATLLASGGDT